jgi:hypothetical protein
MGWAFGFDKRAIVVNRERHCWGFLYWAKTGAAEGTRTPAYSLASCRTTPILRPLRSVLRQRKTQFFYSTALRRGQERAGVRRANHGRTSSHSMRDRREKRGLVNFDDARRLDDRRLFLALGEMPGSLFVNVHAGKFLAVLVVDGYLPVAMLAPFVAAQARTSSSFFLFLQGSLSVKARGIWQVPQGGASSNLASNSGDNTGRRCCFRTERQLFTFRRV